MKNDDIAPLAQPSAYRRLKASRQAWLELADNAELGLYLADASGSLLSANRAFARILGWDDAAQLLREAPQGLEGLYEDPQRRSALLATVAEKGQASGFQSRIRRRDGRLGWISESARLVPGAPGRKGRIEGLVIDVDRRLVAEDELLHSSLYDSLTGLPNRGLLLDRLNHALQRCQRDPQLRLGVIFVTLNHLGSVNGSLGHLVGDQLLLSSATRLQAAVRACDSVARISGNCFAVLLDDCRDPASGLIAVQRLRGALRQPLALGEEELAPSASLGLAFGGAETEGPESLLQDAEVALHQALKDGNDSVVTFDGRMHAETTERLALEHGLRRAVERDEIWVAFQPVVQLKDGRLQGFEALARWDHPRLGQVRPDRFIPVAEASGQIEGLGARVLEIACSQRDAWARELPSPGPFFVSVNLSPRQLLSPTLVSMVAEAMARHGMGAGTLKLEITESLLVLEPERSRRVMEELTGLGATLWLDDFGTGYSSLGSIAQFPLHGIKLDRSFVRDLEGSEKARAVLDGSLSLARKLRLQVVAEGIENVEQARILREAGCPLGQGYLYSPPLPEQQARLFLFQGRLGAAPI